MADEIVKFLARKVEGDAFGRFGASGLLHGVKRSECGASKARQRPRSRQDTACRVPQSSGDAAYCTGCGNVARWRLLSSGVPDDELLRLARGNELRHPGVLKKQVHRMLRDVRSRALVDQFAGQWLQFRNIDVVRPDLARFPEFDDGLRRSMRRETEQFIEHLIREDRSVLEILNADYSFVDERLARFYGIPDVAGPEFRRVSMSGTRRGGGILAHASTLTVSSYSTRTSPVLRGKWILENQIGRAHV